MMNITLIYGAAGRMQKFFSVVSLFIIASFFSFPSLSKQTASLPEIVLNDTNKFPYTTANMQGFLDVLLVEAFKRIGYKLKTVRLPAERGLLSANEGIVDGEVNRIAGIEKIYKNLVRIPEQVRYSDFCVLSKNANIINSPEMLSQHVVGYIKGWKIYEKMMKDSNNIIMANNPQQLFRLLKIDRIEVALYTCLQGNILAKELSIEGVNILEPRLNQRTMHVYLNKKHSKIVPLLSQALQDIKQEGLYEKWYKEKILPFELPSQNKK